MIFARQGHIEAQFKRFHASLNQDGNAQLAEAMNRNTIRVCANSKLPYYFFDHSHQKGSSFGEKLSHAFGQIFEDGYDNVIAIGNDCPGLMEDDLSNADKALKNGQMVLGPAKDGGVYLIGLNKKNYAENVLATVKWQTKNVFSELLGLVNDSVEILAEKIDMDGVVTKRQVLRSRTLLRSVWRIITSLLTYNQPYYELSYLKNSTSVGIPRRGPPQ